MHTLHVHTASNGLGYTLHVNTIQSVEKATLHVHTAGGGKGYTLHVHTAGGGNGYILQVHTASMVVKGIPTARLNCMKWKVIHPARHRWLLMVIFMLYDVE
jgi:hypothetical protein